VNVKTERREWTRGLKGVRWIERALQPLGAGHRLQESAFAIYLIIVEGSSDRSWLARDEELRLLC